MGNESCYDQEAVRNCAVYFAANYGGRFWLTKKAENPFKMGYDPELHTSPELDPDTLSFYLTVINILRWMIKLGRIDIITKVSILSLHVVLPRKWHLVAVLHAIACTGQ